MIKVRWVELYLEVAADSLTLLSFIGKKLFGTLYEVSIQRLQDVLWIYLKLFAPDTILNSAALVQIQSNEKFIKYVLSVLHERLLTVNMEFQILLSDKVINIDYFSWRNRVETLKKMISDSNRLLV